MFPDSLFLCKMDLAIWSFLFLEYVSGSVKKNTKCFTNYFDSTDNLMTLIFSICVPSSVRSSILRLV